MIIIKSKSEIELMREAGKIVADTHEVIRDAITPGISTLELDKIAEENIKNIMQYHLLKAMEGFQEVYVLLLTTKLCMEFLVMK